LTADTADIKFYNSRINLFLGPTNPFLRSVNCSFRAFRVSTKQLYDAPFEPPPQFAKTEDTLVLLDFSAGEGRILPDRSGHDHHGDITGGRWSN
jgi:hypothetical protein